MDNFKIIYKILRELEKNMGNENFSAETISAEKLNIPFEKWEQIFVIMQKEGYIKGLFLITDVSQNYWHIMQTGKPPQITIKGLEYLANNEMLEIAEEITQNVD